MNALAYCPDGTLIAYSCDDQIVVVDAATGEERSRLLGHSNSVGFVDYMPQPGAQTELNFLFGCCR